MFRLHINGTGLLCLLVIFKYKWQYHFLERFDQNVPSSPVLAAGNIPVHFVGTMPKDGTGEIFVRRFHEEHLISFNFNEIVIAVRRWPPGKAPPYILPDLANDHF